MYIFTHREVHAARLSLRDIKAFLVGTPLTIPQAAPSIAAGGALASHQNSFAEIHALMQGELPYLCVSSCSGLVAFQARGFLCVTMAAARVAQNAEQWNIYIWFTIVFAFGLNAPIICCASVPFTLASHSSHCRKRP